MRPFYQDMAVAVNLHKAAREALLACALDLLSAESVNNFCFLAQKACQKAISAMEFAVTEEDDVNNLFLYLLYRDRLKTALDKL